MSSREVYFIAKTRRTQRKAEPLESQERFANRLYTAPGARPFFSVKLDMLDKFGLLDEVGYLFAGFFVADGPDFCESQDFMRLIERCIPWP